MADSVQVTIDIGGTMARGAAFTLDDRVFVPLKAPSQNLRSMSTKALIKLFQSLFEPIKKHFGSSPLIWHIGSAGIRPALDDKRFDRLFKKIGIPAGKVHILPDYCGNWASAFAGQDGVVSVNGTGSVIFGRTKSSQARVGGWGYLLDELPSGAKFGQWVFQGILAYLDGEKSTRIFFELFQKRFSEKLSTREEILGSLYKSKSPQRYLGTLAPIFSEAFESKNPFAREKLINSLQHWAYQMISLVKSLEFPLPVLWSGVGGLWKEELPLAGMADFVLSQTSPGTFVRRAPTIEVEWGPYLWYQISLGADITKVLAHMKTLKPVEAPH